jgi:hypothetical protein
MHVGDSKKALLALLATVLILAACSPGATATPPPKPTPPPVQAGSCKGTTAHTVWLEVQSPGPGAAGDASSFVSETTPRILEAIGLDVVGEGDDSDAHLTITLAQEALGADYLIGEYCYSGARAWGVLRFAAAACEPVSIALESVYPPPRVIDGCADEAEYAPFGRASPPALLSGLSELWGMPVLTQAVKDENKWVRYGAVQALAELGPGDGVVVLLVRAMTDEDEDVSDAADEALLSMWVDAIPQLVAAMSEEDPAVAAAAVEALGGMGAVSVPALVDALSNEDEAVRKGAARALAEIGAEAVDAVPALVETLADEDDDVRIAAAIALGEIGPGASDAVPALIHVVDEMGMAAPLARSALEAITGQDFAFDAEAWQEWWEEQE